MEEIKYRAWNIVTQQMIDLRTVTPLVLNIDTDGLFIPFSDGLIVMKYIGKKDKNNKEVYQGDFIKTRYIDKLHIEREVVGIVIVEPLQIMLDFPNHGIMVPMVVFDNDEPEDFEIVGNEYENNYKDVLKDLELLKEE